MSSNKVFQTEEELKSFIATELAPHITKMQADIDKLKGEVVELKSEKKPTISPKIFIPHITTKTGSVVSKYQSEVNCSYDSMVDPKWSEYVQLWIDWSVLEYNFNHYTLKSNLFSQFIRSDLLEIQNYYDKEASKNNFECYTHST